jgi:hypothetical protein
MADQIDMTPEEIETLQAMIKQVTGGTPPVETPVAPPAPTPIKMNIAGQDMEFSSLADAEAKMNEVVKLAAAHIQQNSQVQKPQATVTGDEAPGFAYDKYVDLMQNGKVQEGISYVLQHDPNYKETIKLAQEANQKLAAYEFRDRHKELIGLPPNQGAAVGQAIAQVRTQFNLPATADGLEAAYLLAQQRGLIPNFAQAPPQNQAQPQNQPNQQHNPWAQPQQQAPVPQNMGFYPQNTNQPPNNNPYLAQNGTFAPPPVIGRGGDNSMQQMTEDQLEALSLPQLEALMKKMGVQV